MGFGGHMFRLLCNSINDRFRFLRRLFKLGLGLWLGSLFTLLRLLRCLSGATSLAALLWNLDLLLGLGLLRPLELHLRLESLELGINSGLVQLSRCWVEHSVVFVLRLCLAVRGILARLGRLARLSFRGSRLHSPVRLRVNGQVLVVGQRALEVSLKLAVYLVFVPDLAAQGGRECGGCDRDSTGGLCGRGALLLAPRRLLGRLRRSVLHFNVWSCSYQDRIVNGSAGKPTRRALLRGRRLSIREDRILRLAAEPLASPSRLRRSSSQLISELVRLGVLHDLDNLVLLGARLPSLCSSSSSSRSLAGSSLLPALRHDRGRRHDAVVMVHGGVENGGHI